MTAMQPYPAYRDSGVEWLGEVPEHWELRRMATVADLRVSNVDKHVREGESPVRLCNYLDVYHNERIGAHLPFMAGTAKEREIRKFRLYVGDVLITKDSEDWSDIGVPALVDYAAQDLVCGYHLAMLRPDGTSLAGGYLFHALKDSHVAWQCQVAAAGVTRYGLSRNAIRSMRIPLPPLPEQTAIARFLDDADRRVRRYIRAKERLIELLDEERRATIHEAVTGRIDVRTDQPYPSYKDSGVEWLGKVPEHWGVVPLKRIGWFSSGSGFPISAQGNRRGEILFAKVSDMNRSGNSREINSTANSVSREVARRLGARVFPPQAIVFPKVGGALLTNKRRVLVHETCIDNNLMGCIVTTAQTEFVFRLLRWLDLGAMAKPGPVPAIGEREVGEIRVPLPPLTEQTAIARFLAATGRRISARRAAVKREIELHREFRTRLIADVVTGKLDVREAAAKLPETALLAADRDRAGTIPSESNPHSTESDMMKEAVS